MQPTIGRTYKVKNTPTGKQSTNGPGTKPGDGVCKVKITRKKSAQKNQNGQMYQGVITECDATISQMGYYVGNQYNFYEYELEVGPYNKEAIQKQIDSVNEKKSELDKEITDLNAKMEWMDAVGVDEFDEDEYKVYKTLSLLEDNNVGKVEKMREIAKLIKQ